MRGPAGRPGRGACPSSAALWPLAAKADVHTLVVWVGANDRLCPPSWIDNSMTSNRENDFRTFAYIRLYLRAYSAVFHSERVALTAPCSLLTL